MIETVQSKVRTGVDPATVRRGISIIGHQSIQTTARYFNASEDLSSSYITTGASVGREPADDVLFAVDPGPSTWPAGFEETPAVTAAYLIDVHQSLDHRLAWVPFFDLLFVAQKDYVDEVRRAAGHDRVEWLPLAASPTTHTVRGLERTFDVGFVGQRGLPGSARHETLSRVLSRFASNEWQRFYTPVEMSHVYGSSRVVINASVNGDLNMRVFEAMAAGSLLVTDRIQNGLTDLFSEGVHYLGYSSPDEAEAQVAAALSDDVRQRRIAAAGQAAVLDRHTYMHRLETVRRAATDLGTHRPAPIRTMATRERALAYAHNHEARREPVGVLATMRRQRVVIPLVPYMARAAARWVNQRVPLTRGARMARRAQR